MRCQQPALDALSKAVDAGVAGFAQNHNVRVEFATDVGVSAVVGVEIGTALADPALPAFFAEPSR